MSVQMPVAPQEPSHRDHVRLDIEGMTCSSCAARIEKKLNRLDGVRATVNFATEVADVQMDPAAGIGTDRLIEAVEHAGYHASPRRITRTRPTSGDDGSGARGWLVRFVVSAVLAIPVIVLGMVPAVQFAGWPWVAFVLTIPVVTWGAWPFHRAAWINLRHGAATMDTLVSLGVLASFGWSTYALLFGGAGGAGMAGTGMPADGIGLERHGGDGSTYFEAAAAIVTFLLAGRWMEARAKHASGSALRALLALGAKQVSVLRDGREERVGIEELAVGDLFVVRPGEKVAADGTVTDGVSAVDMSLLTGESVPVEIGPSDRVVGGAVNANGRLVVRATGVGSDTTLARIAALVEAAQATKAPVQRLADRVSGVFVPVVLVLAALTLAVWLAVGAAPGTAVQAAVAVLIIACPCALGLATPTALMVGSGRGAQLGIVIRGPQILEQARRVETVVLDKTGTVTEGRMGVASVVSAPGTERVELLRAAGAAESGSEHPIARAITAAAEQVSGGSDLPGAEAVEAIPGHGVRATVDGRTVLVGRPALMASAGLAVPDPLSVAMAEAQSAGRTAVLVAVDDRVIGTIAVADTIRASSARAIGALRRLGLRTVLLTGDNRTAAAAVAAEVGIDDVRAEVLPEDKVRVVRELQRAGGTVAMVGDGVNDAAALATADLGIAMGAGTDAAIEAGDLTLVGNDLMGAVDAIRLSRATLRTIRGNLVWAFGYNVAMIPLAALGYLNPMFAGAAMAFSSVFVVTNSLRLRSFRALRD